jgi:fatty acid amide hydrolase
LWNILHYPAGIVPITHVQQDEQQFEDQHNDFWTDLLKETAEGSEGMPVGIQVVGHNWEDEKVLGVM